MGSGASKSSAAEKIHATRTAPDPDDDSDDEPTTIPVVDRKALDLSKFGGKLVHAAGSTDLSGSFSMQRAKVLCELSKLVYFKAPDWSSNKKPPAGGTGECKSPDELSMPLRYVFGDLTRVGATKKTHKFKLRTLDSKYNREEKFDGKTLTWRNGILSAPQSDTEGILLVDQDGKYATLSLRGTSAAMDVLTDLKCWKTKDPTGGKGRCHSGIANAYADVAKSVNAVTSSLFKDMPSLKKLFVTGHSLGGGLATFAAKGIKMNCPEVANITVYTFGGAIVGNTTFKKEYDAMVPNTYRVVNDRDLIPQLGVAWPTNLAGFNHVGKLVFMNSMGVWYNPAPAVLRIDTGQQVIERVTDHFCGKYMKLLKKYRSLIYLSRDQVQTLSDAWQTYLVRTVSRVEYSLTLEEDEDKTRKILPHITRQVMLTPNVAGLQKKLAAELSSAGISAEQLLLEANRQSFGTVSRDGVQQTGWEHFVSAGYGLLYEPDKEKKAFRLQLGAHLLEFEKYDADNDGFLDEKEFIEMRRHQGENDGEKALASMRAFDIDNDGKISKREYAFWRSLY